MSKSKKAEPAPAESTAAPDGANPETRTEMSPLWFGVGFLVLLAAAIVYGFITR